MARMLLVDDEPAVRWVLADLLQRNGHECIEAGDGVEALTRLRDLDVDLILSDVVMPRMDGFLLLRELLPRIHDRVPFVFLTSLDDVSAVEAAVHAGAFDYVVKPCMEQDLVSTIRRALDARDTWRRSGRPVRVVSSAVPKEGSSPIPGSVPVGTPALAEDVARHVAVPVPGGDETPLAPPAPSRRGALGGFLRRLGLGRS
jgi:CheY-like chemotaxis protein